jgi:biofilm protein TabA
MIFDLLLNIRSYQALNRGFLRAIDFIEGTDLKALSVGRYEIDGKRVYAMVSKESGRKKEDSQLEIHKRYTDIQLVLSGTDNMGFKPLKRCTRPAGEYNMDEDIGFFNDEPDVFIPVRPGYFVTFLPEDAHMPLIGDGELHKVVIKVEENYR